MANKLYDESKITDIGRAIQIQLGVSSSFSVAGMAAAIFEIKSQPILQSLSCSVNGTYSVPSGFDGFSQVVVSVPTGASASAVLGSKNISSNGTYNAANDGFDGFSQVVVSVPTESSASDDSFINLVERNHITYLYNSQISRVGPYAFFAQGTFQTVELPAASWIGYGAFAGNNAIVSCSFPACLSIGSYAFSSCTLSYIYFPICSTIEDHAFDNALFYAAVSLYEFPECIRVGDYAFYSVTGLKEISFPKADSFGFACFMSCSISSFYMAETTWFGSYLFANCSNLCYVSAPRVGAVYPHAFENCTSLRSIELPSVWEIDEYAFYGCTRLSSLFLPYESVCNLSDANAFEYTLLSTTGYIYVLYSLMSAYKTSVNWSVYASRIVGYDGVSPDVILEEP